MTEHEELEEMDIPDEDEEDEDDEEMGAIDKIVNVFLDPGALFRRLAQKPEWLLPLIVVIVVQIGLDFALTDAKSGVTLEAQRFAWRMEAQSKHLSEEDARDYVTEKEKKLVETSKLTIFAGKAVSLALGYAFLVAIIAGIMFLTSLIQGLETSYKRVLSVVSFSAIIGLIGDVIDSLLKALDVVTPESMADWSLPVTGLGYYLPENTHLAIKMLCTRVDPFKIWVFVAMIIGLTYVNRCSRKAAIITVAVFIIITLLWLTGSGFLQQLIFEKMGDGAGGSIRVES